MATNAHQKRNEINLETRRRELLSEIPVRALDVWQQGEPMPQPVSYTHLDVYKRQASGNVRGARKIPRK